HGCPSVEVGERHQREEPRALDRRRELALVAGGRAGDARRNDAAVLVDEILEDVDGLVIDPFDLLGSEAAELAAPEEGPLSPVLLVLALALELPFTALRWRHVYFPSMNSMFVTCSTGFLERRFFAHKNPSAFSSRPIGPAASSRAWASNATASSSACTLRRPPASARSD